MRRSVQIAGLCAVISAAGATLATAQADQVTASASASSRTALVPDWYEPPVTSGGIFLLELTHLVIFGIDPRAVIATCASKLERELPSERRAEPLKCLGDAHYVLGEFEHAMRACSTSSLWVRPFGATRTCLFFQRRSTPTVPSVPLRA